MGFGWIRQLVIVAVLGPVGDPPAGPDAGIPEPIITQRTTFAIPFTVPAATDPGRTPTHVLLSVSPDLGASWKPYGQVTPEKGHFVVGVEAEGEYWFSIQTRDRAGNYWPNSNAIPGLRVRVDTTPPKVDLSASRGDGGEVTARWHVEDPHVRPEDIALAYRPGGNTPWQEVALGPQHQSQSGNVYHGEVTWWPQRGSSTIEVRVEASDAARNQSAATATVEMTSPADRTVGSQSPTVDSAKDPPATEAIRQPWPAQPHPALANPYDSGQPQGASDGDRPEPDEVRSVNSRMFELEFDLDSVDSAEISHIELWGTRDNGRTWRSISLHPSSSSPILAKVDHAGVYGFRMVLHGPAGSGRKPEPGDSPDIRVRVDLAKPVAHIISAEEGTGPEADHLIIAFAAEDEQLAEAPVSLAYSLQRGGPWTSIAKQLPNTGRYAWRLPSEKPGKVFLRLEVRDAAGNTTQFETSEPVALEGSPPKADAGPPKVHIREVRPVGDRSGHSLPRRYIFR